MSRQLCGKINDGTGAPANCCPPSSCGLLFQKKAGTATLCGFSEFTNPSTPPKKYRRQDIGGSIGKCEYHSLGCAGSPYGQAGEQLSGYYSYSAADCAVTNTMEVDYLGFTSCGNWYSIPNKATITTVTIAASGDGGQTINTTPTRVEAYRNGCIDVAPDSTNYTDKNGGTGLVGWWKQLSNEDTEDDAIARANAAIGAWTTCTSGCTAYKAARGAGVFSLAYQSIQFKIVATGGVVGTTYEATLNLRKRAQGSSDPWVDWAEMYHQFTQIDGGYTSAWIDLPCESGYEVEISACWIRKDT